MDPKVYDESQNNGFSYISVQKSYKSSLKMLYPNSESPQKARLYQNQGDPIIGDHIIHRLSNSIHHSSGSTSPNVNKMKELKLFGPDSADINTR